MPHVQAHSAIISSWLQVLRYVIYAYVVCYKTNRTYYVYIYIHMYAARHVNTLLKHVHVYTNNVYVRSYFSILSIYLYIYIYICYSRCVYVKIVSTYHDMLNIHMYVQ